MTEKLSEPLTCEVRTCDMTREPNQGAAKAKYYCKTEQRFTCEEDNEFCHRMAHNWKELETNHEENVPKEGGEA